MEICIWEGGAELLHWSQNSVMRQPLWGIVLCRSLRFLRVLGGTMLPRERVTWARTYMSRPQRMRSRQEQKQLDGGCYATYISAGVPVPLDKMSLFRELKGEGPSVLGDLLATLVQPHAVLRNERREDRGI